MHRSKSRPHLVYHGFYSVYVGHCLDLMCCPFGCLCTMKGTEVQNPWCSSAWDCTCVLTRNRSLSRDCLRLAMRILFCSCPCKVHSRVSDALSQALYNLSLAFLADFTLSDSTAPTRFIAKLFSLTSYTLLFV